MLLTDNCINMRCFSNNYIEMIDFVCSLTRNVHPAVNPGKMGGLGDRFTTERDGLLGGVECSENGLI